MVMVSLIGIDIESQNVKSAIVLEVDKQEEIR